MLDAAGGAATAVVIAEVSANVIFYERRCKETLRRCRESARRLVVWTSPATDVDLAAVVKSGCALRKDKDRFAVEIGPLPRVWGDYKQSSDMFECLLDNAIKFRRADSVSIRVHANEEPVLKERNGRTGAYWEVFIDDDGIGVETKFRYRVFELFQRLHDRYTYDGCGLGLAIVQRTMMQHGGHVDIVDKEGPGTRVRLEFPVEKPVNASV